MIGMKNSEQVLKKGEKGRGWGKRMKKCSEQIKMREVYNE